MSDQLCLVLVTAFTVLNAGMSVLIHAEIRRSRDTKKGKR